MKNSFPSYRTLIVGLFIGLTSLLIPLLRDLHWESAGFAALVSAFYAGIRITGKDPNKPLHILRDLLGLLIGWSLALLLYSILTNCFSWNGLAFWLFGPLPSAFFGGATGRVFHSIVKNRAQMYTVITLIAVAVIPTLIKFFSFPQLYFFNHVWNYWPGPIYDEIVEFDTRLLAFRSLTIFWVAVLWFIPGFFRNNTAKWIVTAGLAAILFSYMHFSSWGLIAPEERIQRELGSVYQTEHFRIFYSAETFEEDSVSQWGEIHEEYLREITGVLELEKAYYRDQPIHSYIYPDRQRKKHLTGAGQTNFVPVWLNRDQAHIDASSLERVLKHELVHIVAKRFGNWFGASVSIGMVEGLAVALAPDRYESSIDRLVAARESRPDADEIRQLFHPVGFYKAAGPISYVISGSFVKHLVENYPAEQFKEAYRTGRLEKAYHPVTPEELVGSWHKHLDTVPVMEEDMERAVVLFQTLSLFEKPCPRVDRKRQLSWHSGNDDILMTAHLCSE